MTVDISDDLRAARTGRDADSLVGLLSAFRAGEATPPAAVEEARACLAEGWTPVVRNAAAMALMDARDAQAAPRIVEALRDPEVAPQAGTLLYVLGQLKGRVPLPVVVEVIREGSFEARAEVVGFLRRADVEPFTDADKAAALRALRGIRQGERGDHAAMAACALGRLDGGLLAAFDPGKADPSTLEERLRAAWVTGDVRGTRLALLEIGPDGGHPYGVAGAVAEILLTTDGAVLRDEAAAALAQLDDSRAAGWLVEVLRRPGMAAASDELVAALEFMGADIPLDLVPLLVREGPPHVARAMPEFLARGDIEPFDDAEESAARRALAALRGESERGAAAEACLDALDEYRASLDATY